MSTPTAVGASSLAEFVRATEGAEFDDGDAERLATILANTRKAFAAYEAATGFPERAPPLL